MDQGNQRDGGERAEEEMQENPKPPNQAAGGSNSKELGKRKAAQNMYYGDGAISSDDEDWETSRDDPEGDPSFRLWQKETTSKTAKIAKKKKAKKSKVVVPSNHPVRNLNSEAGASSNVERNEARAVKLPERKESVKDNEDRNNVEIDIVAPHSDEETFGDGVADAGNSSSDWENVETRATKLSASSGNGHKDRDNLGIYTEASHLKKTMAIKRPPILPYRHQTTGCTCFPKAPCALKSATLPQARSVFKYPVRTVPVNRHGPGSLTRLKPQSMIVKTASSRNDHKDQNNLGIYASASHSEKTMAIKRTTVPYYGQNTKSTRFPKTPYALKSGTHPQARQVIKYPVRTVPVNRHGPGSLARLKPQSKIVKKTVPFQRGVPYVPMKFGRPVVRTDLDVEELLNFLGIPLVPMMSSNEGPDTALDVFGFNRDQIMETRYPLPNNLKFPKKQENSLEDFYFSHKEPGKNVIEVLSGRIHVDWKDVETWFVRRRELDAAAGVESRTGKTPDFVVKMEKAALFYGTAVFNGSIRRKVLEWALAGTTWPIDEVVAHSIFHHFVYRKSPYSMSPQGIRDIHASFRSLPEELGGKPGYLFLEHQFIHVYLWDESVLRNAAHSAKVMTSEALDWFRKRRVLAEQRGDADFPYKPFGPWDERFVNGESDDLGSKGLDGSKQAFLAKIV